MNLQEIEAFAVEWVSAWNAHDLDRVLSHYTEDFTLSSPLVAQIVGESSGQLCGKEAVGAYWGKALALIPDLHFELLDIFPGVDSLVLHYRNHQGRRVAEVFFFDPKSKLVSHTAAHYLPA